MMKDTNKSNRVLRLSDYRSMFQGIRIINVLKHHLITFMNYLKEFKKYMENSEKSRELQAIEIVISNRHKLSKEKKGHKNYFNLVPFLFDELQLINQYQFNVIDKNDLELMLKSYKIRNKLLDL